MAPLSAEQEKQQESGAACASVYMQLPEPSPPLPMRGLTGQTCYDPATSSLDINRLAGPSSSPVFVASSPCPDYPPQQYAYAATYSPQQYVTGCSPQQLDALPLGYPLAAGIAVTGYPAASGHPVQPAAMVAHVQGVPAAEPADPQAEGCCTVGVVLLVVGFVLPVCWLVCAFLPCFSKFNSVHDKRAATLSGVLLATLVAVVVMRFGLG
ncbi:hypothetical protein COO60DRAFT_1468717, partial [Scenedesmus sp. NREL 46B-D3]